MHVRISQTAAKSGVLRVWLRRIPEQSGAVHAFRINQDGSLADELGVAYVYGRGRGSEASQRLMLEFVLRVPAGARPVAPGEPLALRTSDGAGGPLAAPNLDILEVV